MYIMLLDLYFHIFYWNLKKDFLLLDFNLGLALLQDGPLPCFFHESLLNNITGEVQTESDYVQQLLDGMEYLGILTVSTFILHEIMLNKNINSHCWVEWACATIKSCFFQVPSPMSSQKGHVLSHHVTLESNAFEVTVCQCINFEYNTLIKEDLIQGFANIYKAGK